MRGFYRGLYAIGCSMGSYTGDPVWALYMDVSIGDIDGKTIGGLYKEPQVLL